MIPFYHSNIQPILTYLYHQYIHFLNLEFMIEVRAYFDFIVRKFHVLFYRLHLNILRFDSKSVMRFLTFVFYRIKWNWNEMILKIAQSFSQTISQEILSINEWKIIIESIIYGFLGILLFKYWRYFLKFIISLIYGIFFPIRFIWSFLIGLFKRKPKVERIEENVVVNENVVSESIVNERSVVVENQQNDFEGEEK